MAVVIAGARPLTEPPSTAARNMGRSSSDARFAVFDLDRTLLPGSSLGHFARGLANAGLLRRWDLARHAVHQGLFAGWAEAIRVPSALGTVAEVSDGRYTGRLIGPFCHGEGKLHRLRTLLGPVELRRTSAYGDATSDLPVLWAVARPVAVNPDRGLTPAAETNRWPIIRLG